MRIENTLDKAIGDAAEELLAEAAKGGTGTTDEVEDAEASAEETPDTPTPDEDDLDENAIKEAKFLYKTLKDKSQGPALIAALAQQAGILKPENLPAPGKETKIAVKTIAQQVVDGLGDEYKFMSQKLGDVIESILESKIAEVRSETQSHIDTVQQEKLATEVNSAKAKLDKETKGEFSKLEPKMLKLMDEFLPSANQSIETYLRGIFTLASSGSQKASAQRSLDDKVRRNANDVTSRLSSTGTGGRTSELSRPAKPGIKNAVEFAIKQLTEQGKK